MHSAGEVVRCGQSLWKKVWRFLKKLNAELLYDPAIPLPGVHPGKMETYLYMKTST